jgi:hypothetical protein
VSAAVDPVAAIRALLLADADTHALVGDQGVVDEIDEAIAPSMPKAIIVLKPSGGPGSPGGGYQQYGASRIDLICYGATLYESYHVYLAVYGMLKHLHRVVSQGVLIHSATPQSKGSTARDPLNQWPVTYSSWVVLAAETAAA